MARVLIVDGNTRARQREVIAEGKRNGGEIYAQVLQRHVPKLETEIDADADGLAALGVQIASAFDGLCGTAPDPRRRFGERRAALAAGH